MAATAAIRSASPNPTFSTFKSASLSPSTPSSVKLPSTHSTKCPTHFFLSSQPRLAPLAATSPSSAAASDSSPPPTFHGLCFVVGDNIDTDQIIPAEYLTLVPSKPDEYQKLGSFALCGLPGTYTTRFVEESQSKSKYSIIIAGENFGCGSSREHAPVALGAAGTAAVLAQSYARIFFRNSVSTGEVYPLESEGRICEECKTGDVVTVELGENKLINHSTGKEYRLKPVGDAGPVVEAGGIFAYARKAGMISSQTA